MNLPKPSTVHAPIRAFACLLPAWAIVCVTALCAHASIQHERAWSVWQQPDWSIWQYPLAARTRTLTTHQIDAVQITARGEWALLSKEPGFQQVLAQFNAHCAHRDENGYYWIGFPEESRHARIAERLFASGWPLGLGQSANRVRHDFLVTGCEGAYAGERFFSVLEWRMALETG